MADKKKKPLKIADFGEIKEDSLMEEAVAEVTVLVSNKDVPLTARDKARARDSAVRRAYEEAATKKIVKSMGLYCKTTVVRSPVTGNFYMVLEGEDGKLHLISNNACDEIDALGLSCLSLTGVNEGLGALTVIALTDAREPVVNFLSHALVRRVVGNTMIVKLQNGLANTPDTVCTFTLSLRSVISAKGSGIALVVNCHHMMSRLLVEAIQKGLVPKSSTCNDEELKEIRAQLDEIFSAVCVLPYNVEKSINKTKPEVIVNM